MPIARSKITAQGRIFVPIEVCRKLGVGPGSVLEWDESNDGMVVRRAGRHTSSDVHNALFPDRAAGAKTLTELKEGVRARMRAKQARR